MRGAIILKELRRENRNAGLRIRGLRFTGFREVLREDGQAVRMGCLPESSKGRLIQRRASTQKIAGTLERGEC